MFTACRFSKEFPTFETQTGWKMDSEYPDMPAQSRATLLEAFRSFNQQLYTLIGRCVMQQNMFFCLHALCVNSSFLLQAVRLGRIVKPLVMQAYNEWVLQNPDTAKKIEDVAKYVSFLLPVCSLSIYELERDDHAFCLRAFRVPQHPTQLAF